MAGIYIHVPFCKQACYYCDFHFSTNTQFKGEVVNALQKEIHLQRNYLESEKIETIYFGGGTPSLLEAEELAMLLASIRKDYDTSSLAEVTLEANPDDLDYPKLEALKKIGINRLSIGVQSFDDDTLKFFHRAHNSKQSVDCVDMARTVGFDNISIDLIYSVPDRPLSHWKDDVMKAVALKPEHISAYSLTIEEKTVFGKRHKKGHLQAIPEDDAALQFEMLIDLLTQHGYEQYEISNFSKPQFYSRHNTSYWQQKKYLGVGPSAHSYNHASRQWNVANNHLYLRSIGEGVVPFEKETLTRENQINEYIFTTLRTQWGCNLTHLKSQFDFSLDKIQLMSLQVNGLAFVDGSFLKLTQKGKLLADKIATDFFV